MTKTLEEQTKTMGRLLVIGYGNQFYQAQVMDCVAGTNLPKRVRIIRDPILQGKVLTPGDYVIRGLADED